MEILTELDGLQEALKKVKMDENVLPYVNGRLCDSGAWNKTQKILNCPEMITAHKYLYNLDMDQLTEEDIGKIDQLYKLGCDRGFIVDDLTDWDAEDAPEQHEAKPKEVKQEEPVQKPVGGTLFKAKVPCWTVIYSATSKDGDIKTGEAYSNAVSMSAAKADVNAKLSRIGYSNISILAIEAATDSPNCCGVCGGTCGGTGVTNVAEADNEDSGDDSSDDSSSDDDASDDSSDDGSDDSSDNSDDGDSEESDDVSDEESDEESGEESNDDSGDNSDDSDSEESDDSSDESNDDSDDSDSEESSDDDSDDDSDDEKEELDANQKSELKDKYRRAFKNVLVKCKFDTSFNDLTLEQKVKFFTELSKAWKKNEPNEFMTDKEIEQLNNVVANPDAED